MSLSKHPHSPTHHRIKAYKETTLQCNRVFPPFELRIVVLFAMLVRAQVFREHMLRFNVCLGVGFAMISAVGAISETNISETSVSTASSAMATDNTLANSNMAYLR